MQRFFAVDPRAESARPVRATARPGIIPARIARAILRRRGDRGIGPEADGQDLIPVAPEEARGLMDRRALTEQVLGEALPQPRGGRR